MSTPALNPLVAKIRAAHPGAYDDMDDAELTKRVLAKYPQYSDLAAPPVPKPQVDMKTSVLGQAVYGPADATPTGDRFPDPSQIAPGPSSAAMGLAGAGAAALGAEALGPVAGKALGPVAGWAARNPVKAYLAYRAIQSSGILGGVEKHIPGFSEMVPLTLLLGGKGGTAAAEGEEAALAEKAAVEKVATPRAGLPATTPTPFNPPPAASWPPAPASGRFQNQLQQRGYAEAMDDAAVKQAMEAELQRHGMIANMERKREWVAANSPATPKSMLVEQAGGKVPNAPVRYTKTPPVSSTPSATPPTDDLTDILNRSLAHVLQKKSEQ